MFILSNLKNSFLESISADTAAAAVFQFQGRVCNLPALVFAPDKVEVRNAYVVKENVVLGSVSFKAEHIELHNGDSGSRCWNQEPAGVLMACSIGVRKNNGPQHVSLSPTADHCLLAVDYPVVAFTPGNA